MAVDESDERFIHRLEAFSDIVIGFSLAQLGANLTIPAHGADLITNPVWIAGFVFAFAVVCSMWFFHHRLFSHFFVPKALPVILNFAWLGLLVLIVYSTELYVRMPADPVVMRLYFGGYTVAYLILGAQYAIGIRYKGEDLDEETRRGGQRGATFMFLWALPFLWCFVVVVVLEPGPLLGILITSAFALAGIASGMLSSRYRHE
jgi:uncharacterized membrane protein